MMIYPNIDPVAVTLGPLEIRWYGVSYVLGILLAWQVCGWLTRKIPFGIRRKDVDDFIPLATLGIVLGGRIGNALFYHPSYYLAHPWEIFYIWQPGMSFHGGFLGVVLALVLFCRYRKISLLSLGDVISIGTPLGLFFGRLANFINGELYGRITDVPWAMVFPTADSYPRHPSQLYEAALEGILLFILMMGASRFPVVHRRPGFLVSVFLIGYGLARSFAEFFRDPDGIIIVADLEITLGQAYSLPLVFVGVFLLWHVLKQPLSIRTVKKS